MRFARALFVLVILSGCGRSTDTPRIPLRDDLAYFHREASTSSSEAQRYFDQGMILYFGFNHEAAIASFTEATDLDPGFAMAWWGRALSHGPNINNTFMDSAAARAAWDAAREALRLAEGVTPLERDLITAVQSRYAWPQPEDRKALDVRYADAMRNLWEQHPDDPDVGALFADALLNLRPWDLWSPAGEPRAETPEIVQTLERVLAFAPAHPGACHFYIHTMEASSTPERARAAADSLRGRIPGAGHLLHMPAHIDIRTGRYNDAIEANLAAIRSDSSWFTYGGFYTMYRAHNFHFLAYAAMFEGRKEVALKAADDLVRRIPPEQVRQYIDFLEAFMGVPYHVKVRFGMWEELLKDAPPPADFHAATAFWHYARTVAFAALGRVKEATEELSLLRSSVDAIPETRYLGNNSARTLLDIGLPMAEGELEYRKGNHDRAFSLLRLAVQRDDSLKYDEPWGWMMPVRHSLGALLLERRRLKEAEDVYLQDLRLHPANGWALKGLAECYHRTGRHDKAGAADSAFNVAWARSDIELAASCFCRTGL